MKENLEPKLAWLREGLGLEEPDVVKMVHRCPNIFWRELVTTR